MQPSSRKPRLGATIEVFLLLGVVVVISLVVVSLNRSPQSSNTTGATADVGLLQETAAPSDIIPSPSPTLDPATLPLPPQASPSMLNPEDPVTVRACAQRETSIQYVEEYSPIIVRGIVKQVPTPRWSTSDGKRPANPRAEGSGIIHRPVILQVEEYLKGEQPQRTLVLFARGGTVGQDTHDYCGDPLYTFQEGEQVVLFLYPPEQGLVASPQTPGGPPLWAIREHYTITADNQAFNIDRQVPLPQLREEIQAAIRTPY